MTTMTTLTVTTPVTIPDNMLTAARDLWDDDDTVEQARAENPEYLRGQVELIRALIGNPGHLDWDDLRTAVEEAIFADGTRYATGDGYTSEPTHLRIYKEDSGDGWLWQLDGADDDLNYTEDVRSYATHAEAVEAMAQFVTDQDDVATFRWAKGRRGQLRNVPVPGRTAWIVDEDGGTFAFPTEAEADRALIGEAGRGAVNLTQFTVTIPEGCKTWSDVAEWAASNG